MPRSNSDMKRHSSRKSRRKDKSSSEKGGMSQYQVLGVIGEGAYGVVMKCRHKKTGEYVAMKKFKESGEADEAVRKTILREVKVLKLMRHAKPVVQLLESFRRKGRLYLVFEFVERNLLEVIEAHPDGCPMGLVDRFMYQLCGAVHECHKMRILHRDIKPENLLVNSQNILKLCDFGFARMVENYGEHLTDYVATRWYRAPELLVGDDTYGPEVDMWAIACIMGELADGDPLFPGDSEIDQLYVIQKMLGPITKPHMRTFLENPRFMGLQFPDMSRPDTLPSRYSNIMSGKHLRFMGNMLNMAPEKRLTAEQCLAHPLFDSIRHMYPSIRVSRAEATTSTSTTVTDRQKSRGSSGRNRSHSHGESKVPAAPEHRSLAHTGVHLLAGKLPGQSVPLHGHHHHHHQQQQQQSHNHNHHQPGVGHKKMESFDASQFTKQGSSLLPECHPIKEAKVAGGDGHRRTQSELGGVAHKPVASFAAFHESLHDPHFSSSASTFPGIGDQDILLASTDTRAGRSQSLPQGVHAQQLHSQVPMTMGHHRKVSSDFSVDSIQLSPDSHGSNGPNFDGMYSNTAYSFGAL